ncbi:MAG TPA: phosphate ABC transporter permease subunit PstC [Cyanobacteria bacterium UBA11149]|nr:phosphate ABC transporter permease subunit PstC [Cyanobacteria bacterium UBA11367]HBE60686.1 phosphate ABC transporter permease subunit PstC [Cyanobacteria bacterium UBA11366]HBK63896.1 phosphate ABC transporter permease subunit PstC [Cyanobacteria bacterium UBA11166]HBR72989.1 phosphate ABC transporter permease subunit PstC [Cyanobacteria bacterium UBA11159]HBS69438.1 phosphate ABC transporter permease subunit PstC [Cyanobacteria bacterium UBA11153]HBW91955.1 phosphate ABC transporter perm
MSPSHADTILILILRGFALVAGAIAILIILFLLWEAFPLLQAVGLHRFFTDASWHPTEGLYNLTPMVWGSLLVTAGSVFLATPLGIASAIFCEYYAPPIIAQFYLRLIELLAGIPSVVYGFWGLVVLVPLIGKIQLPGTSLLAGILVLTLMILPTISLTATASFAKVPLEYLLGAAALGISRWATIRVVVLTAAKSGLFTGLILGIGRAIGETMAVLMVCGNMVQTPKSIFDSIRTITANIALEMAYATGNHRAALFASGLMLMAIIIVLITAAEIISQDKIYD